MGILGAALVRVHHDFDQTRFLSPTSVTAAGYGAYLGTQFKEANMVLLVATLDNIAVGYAWAGVEGIDYMSLRGPAGVLYDIVVAEAHRGHGTGQLLLDAVLEALAVQGAPIVVLSTAARNAGAQRLFTRNGFRETMIEMTRALGASTH